MTPNWEAMNEAVKIMLVATPLMFGLLTMFALAILGLSAFRRPAGGAR